MGGLHRSAPRACLPTALLCACAGAVVALLAPAERAEAQDRAPAPADPQAEASPLSPKALELIDRLDAPDVATRIKASNALLDPAVASTRALEGAMLEGKLRPEQHRRLLNVILYRFFTEPRAAMGIQWNRMADNTRSVVLTTTNLGRGFHAEQVLHANDRIEAVDGFRITNPEQLPGLIVARDPGEEVVLDIVRDGKPMKVTVRLGNFTDLNEPGARVRRPEQDAMIRGWLYRSAPYAARADESVIDTGLTREAWAVGGEENELVLGRAPRRLAAPGEQRLRPIAIEPEELPAITAGGEARGSREEPIFYGLGDARAHPAAVMAIQGDRDVRLQNMLLERTRRVQELSLRGAALGRMDLTDAQRLQLQREIDKLEQELDSISSEIQRLQRGR